GSPTVHRQERDQLLVEHRIYCAELPSYKLSRKRTAGNAIGTTGISLAFALGDESVYHCAIRLVCNRISRPNRIRSLRPRETTRSGYPSVASYTPNPTAMPNPTSPQPDTIRS